MTTAFERLFVDRASQAAVGAFTCYDLETAAAVLRAAERRSTPGCSRRWWQPPPAATSEHASSSTTAPTWIRSARRSSSGQAL
jgi:hypothetical protein